MSFKFGFFSRLIRVVAMVWALLFFVTSCKNPFGGGDSKSSVDPDYLSGGGLRIVSVSPARGVYTGGTTITLSGSGFLDEATITIGGNPCGSVAIINLSQATCVTPAGSVGAADIVLANAPTLTTTLSGGFTYQEPHHLEIVQGNGQSAEVGSSVATSPQVRVVDQDGYPITTGVSVDFAVTSGGGSVGSASAVTDANGLASTTWTLGTATGVNTITAENLALAGTPKTLTFTATATNGPASQLVFTTQPGGGTGGTAWPTQPIIELRDAYNNLVVSGTDATRTVTMSLSSGTGVLSGTVTKSAVAGVADFSSNGLKVNLIGSKVITASATASGGAISQASDPFIISVGPISLTESLVFATAPTIAKGGLIAFVVQAKDAGGNDLGVGGSDVTFALSSGAGVSQGNFGATIDSGNGYYISVFTATAKGTAATISAAVTGLGSFTDTDTVTVINSNPSLTAPSSRVYPLDGVNEPLIQSVASGDMTFSATDIDGDTVTFPTCTYTTPGMSASDPNYVASATNCSSLSGLTLNSTTGVLNWTPVSPQRGTYRISVTASDGDGGTATTSFFVTVREGFVSTNLITALDAQVSKTVTGLLGVPAASRSGTDTSNWLSLTNSFNGTLTGFISSWTGTGQTGGALNPYHLVFSGNANDKVELGTAMSSRSQVMFSTWINPSSVSTPGSVILGDGGGDGTGFVLKQSEVTAGRVEFRIGHTYKNAVLADNPIGYWRLGEISGTTAYDETASSNDGTYQANATINQAGALSGDADKSARFSGLASSYVALPNGSVTTSFGDFTAEAWVRQTSRAGWQTIIGFGSNGWQFDFNIYGGKVDFWYDAIGADFTGTALIPLDTWTHVAFVRSGTTFTTYINGVVDRTAAIPGTAITLTTGERYIGGNTSNENIIGYLDEVALYNYALTANQILAHYKAGASSCTSTTVLANNSWNFISGIFDGTNAKLFVGGSGTPECTVNYGTTDANTDGIVDIFAPSTNLTFGATSSGTNAWSGKMSDLKVYSSGSDAHITTNHNATVNRHQ